MSIRITNGDVLIWDAAANDSIRTRASFEESLAEAMGELMQLTRPEPGDRITPTSDLPSALRTWMIRCDAVVGIPLRARERLVGVLLLGPRSSGYLEEEIASLVELGEAMAGSLVDRLGPEQIALWGG